MGVKERREKEKELRKGHILDTAKMLLLERGLKATSINQIARQAELSVGAIYFYFKDKEDLFAALQLEGLTLLSQAVAEAIDDTCPPEEKIRRIMMAYLCFSQEYKNYFDIINYFLSSPETLFSAEMKDRIDQRGNDSILILRGAISEGMEKGLFKELDPGREAIILWAACHGMIQLKKLERTILSKESHQSLYRAVVERFLEGIRRR